SYDSQYGHTGGGVFNVVLKSGTNDFHFTGWEFLRRKWMDANTFQNKSLGRNADGTERYPRPAHRLDQYGWQFDGPLVIPKLLKKDGRVRGFFLGSYEGYYEEWPQFLQNSYPEPEMRDGDFSRLRTSDARPITIYDPLTTVFVGGDPVRSPFPGNRIPAQRISPVARALTRFMPAPNAVTPDERYSRLNHLRPDYAATDNYYNLILKFDFNFGNNHRTFFRHASNDRQEDRCVNAICSGPGMDGQQPFERTNDAYVLDWIWLKSPTLVFNVRASHNRFIEKGFGRGNEGFDLTSHGLPASLVRQLPSLAYFGRWEFNGGVYSNLGRYLGNNITNNYGLNGNVTKIAGGHTMHFGVDLRRIHFITRNNGNVLFFDGRTQWTQRIWNQGESNAGDPYASFLIGGVNGSVLHPLFPFFRQWYFAPYFQDDWKVSRRLTLNIGLRWDYNPAPDEKYNRINRGFNANVASPIASQIPADMLARYPELRNLKGGLEFAGVGENPRTVSRNDLNNWQPRIGAAFRITDKLVMRGGYGLYYLNPNNDYHRTHGFSVTTPLVNSLDGGRTLLPNLLENPYPTGITVPAGASLGYSTLLGQNPDWFNGQRFWTPRVHQFSFGFQRQLTNNGTVELAYVGSRTVGANSERDFNIPSLDFRKRCNLLEGGSPVFCNEQIPNPFRGIAGFSPTTHFTAATLSRNQLARPFPQFNGPLLERGRNDSNIWYNSLQINYN
ncbi:MAG: TonB-dependent receptor domain-containing protein, partial [Gammaproteobacteria bacterium]